MLTSMTEQSDNESRDSGCTTILLVGKEYSSKQILIDGNGGSTVVFSRFGTTQGISDSFMNNN